MKLYYFEYPGRAEGIRLLLSYARIPFEDIRVKFQDWPALKPTIEGQQLPILQLEDKRYIAQSYAILEYLGMKYGFMPTDPEQAYNVIAIMNSVEDLATKMMNAYTPYGLPFDEAQQKKMRDEIEQKDAQVYLGFIEKFLADKKCKSCLVGEHLTIADFYVFGWYINWQIDDRKKLIENANFIPLLKAYYKEMYSLFAAHYDKGVHPKPKFYYFDAVGRGEMVRLLLKHAKIDHEDIRIKYSDWSSMKTKFELLQVPVWEEDGKQMPETDAIMHYLCSKHGYIPYEPEKYYRTLFICNTIKDFFEGFVKFFYGKFPEDKKAKLEADYYTNTVPLILSILESRLKEGETKGEYFIGAGYTMADFYMLGAAKWLILAEATNAKYAKCLNNAPILKSYLEKRLKDFI